MVAGDPMGVFTSRESAEALVALWNEKFHYVGVEVEEWDLNKVNYPADRG